MGQALWTRNYFIIILTNFLNVMNFILPMVIMSRYAIDCFAATSALAGLTSSTFIIGALISRFFTGSVLGLFGYKRSLVLGEIISLAMVLLYFVALNLPLLIAVRFVHGLAFGLVTSAAATICSDIIPAGRSGEGMGYYQLGATITTAVAPFLGVFFSERGDYTAIFLVCSLCAAASIALLPLLRIERIMLSDEQKIALSRISLDNAIDKQAMNVTLVNTLTYICYSGVVSFLAIFASENGLVEAATVFFLVYAVVVLVSRPLVGKLFDTKGEGAVMIPGIIFAALGLVIFSQSYDGFTLLASAVLIGLGVGTVQISTMAIVVRDAPQHKKGVATSTYFMFSDAGFGLGPLMIGLMIPFLGLRNMYLVLAFVAFACLPLYQAVHGSKKGNKRAVNTEEE